MERFRSHTTVLPKDELRAAWVVRYALTSQDEIDRAVDYAIRARFHLLFVQVRGRGDAYYVSDLEPAAGDVERPVDEFDPLEYFLARAHEAGIAVHVWINVYYVWSDHQNSPPPDHIVRRHPEWLVSNQDGVRMDKLPVSVWQGRGIEGYFVSPSNREVRRHIVEVIQDITSRYPIDGVHLDYVRYPGIDFDFGPTERTAFALRFGVDPLHLRDDVEEKESFSGVPDVVGTEIEALLDSTYTEWRVSQVDSLVRLVRTAIGKLPLSAAVVPEIGTARVAKGQGWPRWVQERIVDFIVPMAYNYEPAELVRLVRTIRRTVGAEHLLVGLPVFDGRSRYLGYSVSLLRQEGVLGYSLFSYNELEKEPFSVRFLERVFLGEPVESDESEESPESDELEESHESDESEERETPRE
ncbi:MAG: family 10 glycosylhydrolase [Candidatus Latescibacterota bacterium]|nr:MAG: family 10 glycosylhydrolase [Candidatus Latescibacterota bacterium]